MRQIVAGLGVDSYAKRVNAVTFCLDQCLAGILYPVGASVGVVVIRFAIRQCDEQFGARLHLAQQVTQMPNRDARTRVYLGRTPLTRSPTVSL